MKAIFTTIENIDTDQIIPARFLKKTSKEGFGEEMFYDWRFNPDGSIKEDSVFATYEGTAKEEKPQVLEDIMFVLHKNQYYKNCNGTSGKAVGCRSC